MAQNELFILQCAFFWIDFEKIFAGQVFFDLILSKLEEFLFSWGFSVRNQTNLEVFVHFLQLTSQKGPVKVAHNNKIFFQDFEARGKAIGALFELNLLKTMKIFDKI